MAPADTLELIGDLADRVIGTGASPGAVVALTDRGRLLGVVTRGHADPASGRPVDAATAFQIGSISKSFTAICLLCQVEDGRLSLDDPVARHLPWFPLADRTVRQLLTHTAGIVNGLDDLPASPHTVVRLRDAPAVDPGRFWYSNVGYQSLGYLLEQLTGEPYAEAYRRQILAPLGMDASSPDITNDLRSALAVGHAPLHDDRPWMPGDPCATAAWIEYGMGDGSVCATAGDLAAYLRMLLNRGDGLLSKRSFDDLVHPAVDDGEGAAYGLGVQTRQVDGRTWIGHTGATVGYRAAMWGAPDDGVGVVSLVNGSAGAGMLAEYALRLALDPGTLPPDTGDLADPAAAKPFDAPPAAPWRGRCGTYRSFSPWMPSLVVGTVEGEPHLLSGGELSPLVDLGDGSFRSGRSEHIPERVVFDEPFGDRTFRCWYSTAPYVRPFNG